MKILQNLSGSTRLVQGLKKFRVRLNGEFTGRLEN